ncbi:MAG: pseudouridine synthase [Solirubrobacteraceae bacterium]
MKPSDEGYQPKEPFDKKYGGRDSKSSYSGRDNNNSNERNLNQKSFSNFRSTPKKRENSFKPLKEGIRLNKFIANSGICSRREADELIKSGLVLIDGQVVSEMGFMVLSTHEVKFDGNKVVPEKQTYVLLNKPKGFISTSNDERARKTVLDLVYNATPYRIYPVGRLDRQTTGVLLLTNDGELTKKLTHPSSNIKKIYHVVLDKKLSHEDLESIKTGVRLYEGVVPVDQISYIEGTSKNEVGIEIHIGWNRVIRRLFNKLGYEVEKLDRVSFGGLTKKNLKRGDWRILDTKEVSFLKML